MYELSRSSGGNARSSRSGWLTFAAALVLVVAASLVLLGWQNDIEALKRVGPGLTAMNPLTACCLMLGGTAIALMRSGKTVAARLFAAAIAALASAKLADVAFGGVAIDQILFSDRLASGSSALPNRMAPNTAAALLLIALAFILGTSQRRSHRLASQALAGTVLLIAMFTLLGYIFGVQKLSTVGPFIPMALHTGLGLLIMALAVLSLNPDTGVMRVLKDEGAAGSLSRMVLPLAFLTPIAVGALRLWGQDRGFYGTESGVAIQVVGNVVVTSLLLISSIFALYRSDAIRVDRERALKLSEDFNRTIIEANPDCVSILDFEGKVLFVNDSVLQAYGLDGPGEVLGKPWGHLLTGSAQDARERAMAAAREGGIGRVTLWLSRPGADMRWYEALISRLPALEGEPNRFMVMSRDITRQKAIEDEVRWTATHDALTKLPNRALFQEQLEQALEGLDQTRFALLLLDVDDFKQVNDALGHDAGDALLCTIGERLREAVRPEDLVARLGGDEFAIILRGVKSDAGAVSAAQNIFERLKEPWVHAGRIGDCRVSIGAAIACDKGEEPSTLLKKADVALYAVKVEGRGRVAVFEPSMRAETQRRSSMISLARQAVNEDLILPYYQPKVDLASGGITGFEALLRWRHPQRGIQSPASIAAAFEDVELAQEITDRMLAGVLRDMRAWLDGGIDFGHVAINAAAADFKKKDFAERLLEHLDEADVPRRCLQVEVTETVFLGRGAEYVERALKTLSADGIGIALDDFGTGYASLSHLKQFQVDVIKIDQSFLRNAEKDPHNAAIISAIVNLGRSLGLQVIAEGVETASQEALLLKEGCQFAQGFLYGKAVPAARLPGLLKSARALAKVA